MIHISQTTLPKLVVDLATPEGRKAELTLLITFIIIEKSYIVHSLCFLI